MFNKVICKIYIILGRTFKENNTPFLRVDKVKQPLYLKT